MLRRHVHRGDLIVTVRPWWYVHNDVYGDLSLVVSRSTLHPWQLALVVQNTVITDRSTQPSRSKKSDRNQKYVDDSSLETVRL
ncbi:hypothetical protein DY000_02039305 [Brassica cretica]|uniref:Uncharacterized protein n=1 Tax=Brassica cretica TaxID=69181 RepID=A0ABQ7BQS9_BRACR|nr:hypothetical protein DY000_02039305 [Brassica cretica]